MSSKAVQDYYTDDLAWCYGCGRLNPAGYQLKTVWEGEETVTRFTPRPYHMAIPGYVNGAGRGGRRADARALPRAGRMILAPPSPTLFAPLRIRNFRNLWLGHWISLIGDRFKFVSLSWLVLSPPGGSAAPRP